MDDRRTRLHGIIVTGLITAAWLGLTLPLVSARPGHSGDSIEFQFLAESFGLAHPPGAPVYVLLVWTWRQVLSPLVDSPALAANLFSVFMAGIVFFASLRLGRRWGWRDDALAVALLALLTSPLFLRLSSVAELYVPALAVSALALWCTQRWVDGGRARDLLLVGGLLGIGAGIHPSVLFAGPACLALVLARSPAPWRDPLAWGALGTLVACFFVCVGLVVLVSYAASFVYVPLDTTQAVVDFVTGRQFHGQAGAFDASLVLEDRLPRYLGETVGVFGPLAVFALIGLISSCRRRHGIALLTLFVIDAIYVTNYGVDDVWDFVLPGQIAAALWIAAGVDATLRFGTRWRHGVSTGRVLAGIGLAVLAFQVPERVGDLRGRLHDTTDHDLARTRMDIVHSQAVLASSQWLDSCALWYESFARDDRDVPAIAHARPPRELVAYAQGRAPLLLIQERREIPVGRDLHVVGPAYAQAMLDAGLHLYRGDADLYLVRAQADPTIAGEHLDPRASRCRYVDGWGRPENWGRWMLEAEATIVVESPPPGGWLRIRASTWAAGQPATRLTVTSADRILIAQEIDTEPWRPADVEVPLPEGHSDDALELTLRVESRFVAPGDRPRALAVQEIVVEEAQGPAPRGD